MNRIRRCFSALSLLTFVSLVGAFASSAFAADPPPLLSKLTVVGQNDDRQVPAGGPLRFRLSGSGKCSVEIQIVEVGTNRAATTQTFNDVELGANREFATSYILPPFGTAGRTPLEKDFTVTALPKHPSGDRSRCLSWNVWAEWIE
jgi:hypothetical protein